MNRLQLTVLVITALSVCCHGNASPTRSKIVRYNAEAAQRMDTCASAGYTDGCCVYNPSQPNACFVPGGQCYCDRDCHYYGDCCADIRDIQCSLDYPGHYAVAAHASGSTCASAGYTSGCCVSTPNSCYVPGGQCYCDVGCHRYGDCCADIHDIQCSSRPRTCHSLGFSPGCCSLSSSSCYVPEATCYCDPTCHTNGDCCIDVTITQCPAQTQRSRASPRVESMRAQRARSMRVREWQSEVARKAADAMENRVQNIQG